MLKNSKQYSSEMTTSKQVTTDGFVKTVSKIQHVLVTHARCLQLHIAHCGLVQLLRLSLGTPWHISISSLVSV